jgi:hypothetical protein
VALQPNGASDGGPRFIRSEARAKLLEAIARGRRWLGEIIADPAASTDRIAAREGLPERSARSIVSLAFLAPDSPKRLSMGPCLGASASPA